MKKLILTQVGRCRLQTLNPNQNPGSSSLLFHRYLSSSASNPHVPPIQPVSYPVKPKREDQDENQNQEHAYQELTKEDIRYVKDAVSSTTARFGVAPLPEVKIEEDQEIENESRKIDAESNRRVFLRNIVEEEENVTVPFPRLIKPVKKDTKPVFDLVDAIRQVKANARTTFDETIEVHVRLGIAKARSDLIVRGTLTLPHGGKKALRIAVFAEGTDAEDARAAGADIVGGVELIDEITRDGKIDFDKCFTTTQMFPRVVKLARILNRHGLMPDAKQGTVVRDVTRAVKEAKMNQIKFKMDKTSIVHVGLGKVSFAEDFLRENVGAFMNALLLAKPAGLKKTSKYAGYVNSVHLCSTMGPGFPVSIQSISKAVDHYNKVHLKSPT